MRKNGKLKMREFFEPMLYMSTPDHPNTMGALAVLKEAVDGELPRLCGLEAYSTVREM